MDFLADFSTMPSLKEPGHYFHGTRVEKIGKLYLKAPLIDPVIPCPEIYLALIKVVECIYCQENHPKIFSSAVVNFTVRFYDTGNKSNVTFKQCVIEKYLRSILEIANKYLSHNIVERIIFLASLQN